MGIINPDQRNVTIWATRKVHYMSWPDLQPQNHMQKGETKQTKAVSLRENPLNLINSAQMICLEKLQGPLKQALKADNTIEKELGLFKLIFL